MKKQAFLFLFTFALLAGIAQNSSKHKDGTAAKTGTAILPEYTGPCACGNPMASDAFEQLVADIKAKATDRSMLQFAKTEITDKCLLASQVEEIMLLFMSTSYRNSFLIFAKKFTYDQTNYYALRLKYPNSGSVVPGGQLYNNNEVNAPKYNRKLNSNELNRNYISEGRKNEIQRDAYYGAEKSSY